MRKSGGKGKGSQGVFLPLYLAYPLGIATGLPWVLRDLKCAVCGFDEVLIVASTKDVSACGQPPKHIVPHAR